MNTFKRIVAGTAVVLVLATTHGCSYSCGVISMKEKAIHAGKAHYELSDSPTPVFTWNN